MTNINRARARVTFIAENYAMLQADSMKIRLMLDRTGRHRADIVVGATVECRYTTRFNSRAKGAHDRHLHDVEQVFSVTAPPAPQLAIVQFMHEKGWGKVGVPGVAEQVFLPRSTWVPKGMQPAAGMKMLAVISENADGFFVSSFEESVEIDRQFDEAYPATFTSESEEELVLASFSPVKKNGLLLSDDGEKIWFRSNQVAKSIRTDMFNGKFGQGVRFVVARGTFAGFPAIRIERLAESGSEATEESIAEEAGMALAEAMAETEVEVTVEPEAKKPAKKPTAKKAAVKKSKADQPTAELPDGPLAGPLKAIGFNGSAANGVTAH